jgi:hypothetical protein
MNKKSIVATKLKLSSETVRSLGAADMTAAHGGFPTTDWARTLMGRCVLSKEIICDLK